MENLSKKSWKKVIIFDLFFYELIQPIQKRVFDAIANYAAQNGYELVLDAASNPTLLYNSEKIDHTQALIEFMKK